MAKSYINERRCREAFRIEGHQITPAALVSLDRIVLRVIQGAINAAKPRKRVAPCDVENWHRAGWR